MKNIPLLIAILIVTALLSTSYAEITLLSPEPVSEPMNMLLFGLGLWGAALVAKKTN